MSRRLETSIVGLLPQVAILAAGMVAPVAAQEELGAQWVRQDAFRFQSDDGAIDLRWNGRLHLEYGVISNDSGLGRAFGPLEILFLVKSW